MAKITELNDLTSAELFRLLITSDSDDWKIKDILRRRRVAGERASFADADEPSSSFTLSKSMRSEGVLKASDDDHAARVEERRESLSDPVDIFDKIHQFNVHKLARLMKDEGFHGQGMKDEASARTWIEVAAADPHVDSDVDGFDRAENFWAAARSKFKRWLVER